MFRVLNSQSRQKEEFKPLDPAGKHVGMYVCGPTVYNSLHLGHARAAITPDIVRRYLEYKGFSVKHVSNFTDIDDKIIKRANEEKRDWRELTEFHIAEFHEMMKLLGVLPATVFPKATEHIPEMQEIVTALLNKKHAYIATDGDVYFDTTTYARYGALSGRKIEEDDAGHSQRISAERMNVKKHPGDFVLWKLAKPGEPFWDSPWGKGRPGWHLECSAMSRKHLGVPFDIHGGGQDLMFPHHEDEKAQTECAYCEELKNGESVKYWVHNGFMTLDGEKMSKSLGNVKWLREMVWPDGPHDPMTVRMIFLSTHYRAPINFEPGLFDEAKARLERIYNTMDALTRASDGKIPAVDTDPSTTVLKKDFEAAMDDDFNTAAALGALFNFVTDVNQRLTNKETANAGLWHAAIARTLTVLGIRASRASNPKNADGGDSLKLVDLLLQVRQDVRAAKLFAVSDKIRNGLKELGYEIEDLPGGKWAVKKMSANLFDAQLVSHGLPALRARRIETLQVNLGKICNQTCRHCHVDAGPHRVESMSRENVDLSLDVLRKNPGITTLDITGGAPELNPHFRYLATKARALNRRVIDRCNLTIFFVEGQRDLPAFLANNQIEVVASLPCYTEDNVDKQRGIGVFDQSIESLKILNALGYGRADSGLVLNLVYNPLGPSLPPPQAKLEADYKQQLNENFGVVFNRLHTITNMPVNRFKSDLQSRGTFNEYMRKLEVNFNPAAAGEVMCRDLISVSWDGRLYDCDFNQMLELPLESQTDWTLHNFDAMMLSGRKIRTDSHCLGCTAGSGSSCGGALMS